MEKRAGAQKGLQASVLTALKFRSRKCSHIHLCGRYMTTKCDFLRTHLSRERANSHPLYSRSFKALQSPSVTRKRQLYTTTRLAKLSIVVTTYF